MSSSELELYSSWLAHADPDRRLHALRIFGMAGTGPTMQIAECLRDSYVEIRRLAAAVLSELDASAVVPVLTQALNDRDVIVRQRAVTALELFGAAAVAAVPALLCKLFDQDLSMARRCAAALGAIGHAAHTAIPALQACVEGDDVILAALARVALRQINGHPYDHAAP
jgi:HEAT repeat protein